MELGRERGDKRGAERVCNRETKIQRPKNQKKTLEEELVGWEGS